MSMCHHDFVVVLVVVVVVVCFVVSVSAFVWAAAGAADPFQESV